MLSWWKRFKPNRTSLISALLATAICSVGLILIWAQPAQPEEEMVRYGNALSQTLAHANATHLMHKERIELAVIANLVNGYEEVDGVVFYSANNDIIAMSGSQDLGQHYTAPATLDDTITGYVSVVLNPQIFQPSTPLWSWLGSIILLLFSPFASLGLMQLSARGNRSLPIVSVPEQSQTPTAAFCLALNLHNQFNLTKAACQQAIEDALSMLLEVGAIHQGLALPVSERGAVLLLDAENTSATHAISAAFLAQRLLQEFETDGQFRCALCSITTPGSAAELHRQPIEALMDGAELDQLMTLAALTKANSVLLTQSAYAQLTQQEADWAVTFQHPLLADVSGDERTHLIEHLPPEQQHLVDSQATVILGFSQASA